MTIEQKIGAKIKKLRIKAGYTSAENFAYENNISRTQYGAYERGEVKMRVDSLYKILTCFDVSLEEFFKGIS